MSAIVNKNTEALKIFEVAKDRYTSDDINIDTPDTEVIAKSLLSRADDGVWVRAWVWVSYNEG